MGIKEANALTLARKIAMYNSEAIFFVKNSLMMITQEIQTRISEQKEKLIIIIKTNYPHVEPLLILANPTNNNNHDLLKLDIELIKDMLLEEPENDIGETHELGN